MGRLKEWRKEISSHKRLIAISIVFLAIAIFLNYKAGEYIEKKTVTPVSDAILDYIPTINLSFLFYYGMALVIALLFIYPLFFKVKELHVVISQFSLLIMIRSFFVSLTHLGTPIGAVLAKTSTFWNFFDPQNALFFSGHTSWSFLGFLLFRKEKIGILFLISTIVMMATVLFMHVHYSIDVFAALFITYGSYQIGNWFFKKVNNK